MSRGRERAAAKAAPRAGGKPAARSARPFRPAAFLSPWLLAGPAALALAFVSARGAPLGTPVCDDYSFLAGLAFDHPLDWFGSMRAAFYWRPLARQAYFSLLGPHLVAAPWLAVAAHAVLLLAVFAVVFDVARRRFDPRVAAAIAVFPLLGEPTRMLLGWPSAAQHLLALLFAALAVREALAGRAWTAGAAAVAGLLSHEAAAIALPFVLLVLWRGAPAGPLLPRLRRVAPVLLLAGLWAAGYAIARRHGVQLPARPPGAASPGGVATLFGFAVPALLDLEDVGGSAREAIVLGYALVAVAATALALRPAARRRVAGVAPALAGGALWFAVGCLPLLAVLDDWNAWRMPVPGVGFGLAAVGLVGALEPWLAVAFTALRVVALLCAPPAPTTVAPFQPVTTSEMSFPRLVRLQWIADGTRRVLLARDPTLPARASVRFQALPRMAEVGLQGPLALRVWYADSTLDWRPFGRTAGYEQGVRYVVAYDTHRRWKPVVIEPAAVELFGRGMAAMQAQRFDAADSLLLAATRAQRDTSDELDGAVSANRARMAYMRNEFALADSLNQRFKDDVGSIAEYLAMQAAIDLARGRFDMAEREVAACLQLEPANATAQAVRSALATARAGQPPPR